MTVHPPRALREAVRLAPDDADANYNLGIALQRAGRPADAIAPLRHAMRCRKPRGAARRPSQGGGGGGGGGDGRSSPRKGAPRDHDVASGGVPRSDEERREATRSTRFDERIVTSVVSYI